MFVAERPEHGAEVGYAANCDNQGNEGEGGARDYEVKRPEFGPETHAIHTRYHQWDTPAGPRSS